MRPAVFFDRDGVLNVEKNYLYRVEDFQWQAGAREAVALLNDKGYYVFVVTNQSGIARGYYKEEDVKALHDFMQKELAKRGAHVDAFYYCPHHPEGKIKKYAVACDCRKPASGMLQKAMADFVVDKSNSFLIGDKASDIEAASAAGIKGYLYTSGNLKEFVDALF